jgi:sugar phosphate isomerase/epimerase
MKRAAVLALALWMLAIGASGQQPVKRPFFAMCMDTHDSEKRNLVDQAALLKELGYDGAGHLWLDNLKERLDTLDAAGLQLYQVYFRVNLAPDAEPFDQRLEATLPLLKGRQTMLAVLVSGRPPSTTEHDARAVEILGKIADMARASNVRVALYPHAGDWIERVEDGLRIVKKLDRPNVGVMLNLCHWLKVDDEKNLEPLLKAAQPHLFAVTICGADTAQQIHAGKGNWIQPLDAGSFDIPAFLAALDKINYTGPVGLQCYGIPGDAREHLTRSMGAWKKLTAK